jgi:hypothetical protein
MAFGDRAGAWAEKSAYPRWVTPPKPPKSPKPP